MSVILIIVASPEKLQDLFLTRFWTTMSSKFAISVAKICILIALALSP